MTDAEAAKTQEEPEVVEETEETPESTEEASAPKQSRTEKKARRLLSKLGMKPVEGVSRVTIKKTKNIVIAIGQPDVFKMPTSDTYIVFGEAKADDLNEKLQRSAAQQFQKQAASADGEEVPDLAPADDASAPAGESAEGEEGVEPRDIELVMQQAGASRADAVAALKKNDGDIVNAIMDLSM
eukprot:INCI8188.1.p2 GENE.INCI8188.1~~INCI8188.1.p2  ORF type:complete len:183 (-),score=50.96 INCI8188.1:698-1246(-)